jgi:hypothetical protein
MSAFLRAAILASAVTFAAPAPAGYNPSTGEAYANYACGGGVGFSAIFERAGTLLIMIGGGTHRLQNAGPDVWRDGCGQEFRRDGDAAAFIVAGKAPAACRAVKE